MDRPVLSLKPKKATAENGLWFNRQELAKMTGQWQRVTGKLVYEPIREDFRKTHKEKTLILELPRGNQMDLYYQWFLEKKFGTWYSTQRPMYGLHVTVVRGDEKPKKTAVWKAHEGEMITVEYNPTELRKKWQFWSMPVRCARLEAIRRELGLSEFHDFHITVAREYEYAQLRVRSLT